MVGAVFKLGAEIVAVEREDVGDEHGGIRTGPVSGLGEVLEGHGKEVEHPMGSGAVPGVKGEQEQDDVRRQGERGVALALVGQCGNLSQLGLDRLGQFLVVSGGVAHARLLQAFFERSAVSL